VLLWHSIHVFLACEVYAWGNNSMGQCGQGQSASVINRPRKVAFGRETVAVRQISAGASHSIAWTAPAPDRILPLLLDSGSDRPECLDVDEETIERLLAMVGSATAAAGVGSGSHSVAASVAESFVIPGADEAAAAHPPPAADLAALGAAQARRLRAEAVRLLCTHVLASAGAPAACCGRSAEAVKRRAPELRRLLLSLLDDDDDTTLPGSSTAEVRAARTVSAPWPAVCPCLCPCCRRLLRMCMWCTLTAHARAC